MLITINANGWHITCLGLDKTVTILLAGSYFILMEKIVRKYRVLKRDWRKSNPDISENVKTRGKKLSVVRLGSLITKSQSLEEEEEFPEMRLRPDSVRSCPADSNFDGFDDLDDATADMMAMFRDTGIVTECSSTRSSVKSKYSIQFETDNETDEDEPETDQFDEEISPNFPGNERFSMFVGQNDESRYKPLIIVNALLTSE